MTRRTLTVWLLVLLPGMAAAASPPAAPPSGQSAQWESYRVLSERNIFLRNRARPSSSYRAPTPAPATPVADSGDTRIVLTGIIQQGGDHLAFFEDTRTGKTTTVQAGDPLGKGRLTTITLDSVQYTCDGKATQIAIGSNLAGTAASPPKPATTPSTTAAPATTPTAPAPPAATSAPAGSVTILTAPAPEPGSTTPPPAAPPQAAAGTAGDTKDSGAAGILERMRQRREQELNK